MSEFFRTEQPWTATCPSRSASVVPRTPIPCLLLSLCPKSAHWEGRAKPSPMPGDLRFGTPQTELRQGDIGLSQVPELPPGMRAPLSDPGGVLNASP